MRSWINYVEDGQIVSDPVIEIENDNDYNNSDLDEKNSNSSRT